MQESKSSLRVYYQLFQLYTVIKSKIQCSPEATETGIFTGYFFQKLQQNNVKYLLRSEINFHVALFLFTCILKKDLLTLEKKKVKVKPKGIDVAEICPLSTNLLLTANYFFQWLAHQRLWRANQEEPSENKERLDRKG